MTAQIPESLNYGGNTLQLFTCPPFDCLEGVADFGEFRGTISALRRGYIGHWSIEDGRFYLVDVKGTLRDGREASLEILAPGCGTRIFAKGFTGNLDCPLEGTQLRDLSCDRLLRIRVESSLVIGERELGRAELRRERLGD